MNYTESLDNVVHPATGQRMHTDTAAITTVQSAKDTNMVIWSLMEVIKAANRIGQSFNPDTPATYQVLLDSINTLIEARVGDFSLDTGAANAYVVVMNPPVTAYESGMEVKFRVANANTAPSTLNAGDGARALVRNDGVALVSGDLPVDTLVTATYVAEINKFVIGSTVMAQSMSKAQADLLYAPLSESSKVPVRQTILTGAANILAPGAGLSVNLVANAVAVRIAYPAGMGDHGATDYVGKFTADQAGFWANLPANTAAVFLFIDRNPNTGAQTGVWSSLPYMEQKSNIAPSTVNGQHTYLSDKGEMYVGNGAAATLVQRTAVGECATDAAGVTAATSYAKLGMYESSEQNTGGVTALSHDIGITPQEQRTVWINKVASNGCSPGDEVPIEDILATSTLGKATGSTLSRNGFWYCLNTGAVSLYNKLTSTSEAVTTTNFKMKTYIRRGF
jgi:hypothetical protein